MEKANLVINGESKAAAPALPRPLPVLFAVRCLFCTGVILVLAGDERTLVENAEFIKSFLDRGSVGRIDQSELAEPSAWCGCFI